MVPVVGPMLEPPSRKVIVALAAQLFVSKPRAVETVSTMFLPLLVRLIAAHEPAFSTAAVVEGFTELILTPSPDLPDVGTVVEVISKVERRFQYKAGLLSPRENSSPLADDDVYQFDEDAFDAWLEARAASGEPLPIELPPPPPTSYAGDAASRYGGGSAAWYRDGAAGTV